MRIGELVVERPAGSYEMMPFDGDYYDDDGFDGLGGVVWTAENVCWSSWCCNCVAGFDGDDLSSLEWR